MIIKVAGHEYCVTNTTKKRKSKSQSLGSLADFNIEIDKTKIDKQSSANNNSDDIKCKNKENKENQNSNDKSADEAPAERNSGAEKEVCCVKSNSDTKNKSKNETNASNQTKKDAGDKLLKPVVQKNKTNTGIRRSSSRESNNRRKNSTLNVEQCNGNKMKNGPRDDDSKQPKQNFALAKSKSEGNPFQHRKKGKIIRITQRPTALGNCHDLCTICSNLYIFLH